MDPQLLEKLRFPVGQFKKSSQFTDHLIKEWIEALARFPSKLSALCTALDINQINWRYRPDGWKIKQVVHHCADSHMNSIIRFKLALTEDRPTIKPYFEERWAELPDGISDDLTSSLAIIDGVHARLVSLLKTLSKEQMQREFLHPEHDTPLSIQQTIGLYAWHSNHHLAHVQNAIEAEGKYN